MEDEEKGFVVKDRRAFGEEGEPREETGEEKARESAKTEEPEARQAQEKETGAGEETSREQAPPLPEVNFSTLIMSLSSSALFHLGEIPDPQTGQVKKDLTLARHTIDIIGMLKGKTAGNLTDDEQKFIDNMLTDLRLRFVKASG